MTYAGVRHKGRDNFIMMSNVAEIGKHNLETLGAIQKQFLDAVTKANQAWMDCH